jgi:hypothetical protein
VKKSRISLARSPARLVPFVHLPLVDLLVDTKPELLEWALRSELKVFTTMLEEDRTAICGPTAASSASPGAQSRRHGRAEGRLHAGERDGPVHGGSR